jgi:hypothetical protein
VGEVPCSNYVILLVEYAQMKVRLGGVLEITKLAVGLDSGLDSFGMKPVLSGRTLRSFERKEVCPFPDGLLGQPQKWVGTDSPRVLCVDFDLRHLVLLPRDRPEGLPYPKFDLRYS